MTAGRKRDAVLRLLRGEPLEISARDVAARGRSAAAVRRANACRRSGVADRTGVGPAV